MAAEIDIPARRQKLISIWEKIPPRQEDASSQSAKSRPTQSYLRQVQQALDRSRPFLEGLTLSQLTALFDHEAFASTHVFPSHAPSFMLAPQPLHSELQREWNRVRVWSEHSDALHTLRTIWRNVPKKVRPATALRLSIRPLVGVPRAKLRVLLSHPDFQVRHDFPADKQFGHIEYSIKDRILDAFKHGNW